MPLLSFEHVSISFGRHALLDDASFQIDPGERVCLIGRNGAGKSTLLKIVDGEVQTDSGEIWRKPGLSISRLAQDLPADEAASVYDVVATGLADVGSLLAEFHHVSHAVGEDASMMKRMEALQMALLEPRFAILDETDSGLDIDALRLVAENVNALRGPDRAMLVITHYQRLLDYIKPDRVHVLAGGRIAASGGPELALELEKEGYDKYLKAA